MAVDKRISPYVLHDIRIEEINEVREKIGLSPLIQKVRKCLRCEKEFKSLGKQNFMCDLCRLVEKSEFELDY